MKHFGLISEEVFRLEAATQALREDRSMNGRPLLALHSTMCTHVCGNFESSCSVTFEVLAFASLTSQLLTEINMNGDLSCHYLVICKFRVTLYTVVFADGSSRLLG